MISIQIIILIPKSVKSMSNPEFEPLLQDEELAKPETAKIQFKSMQKQKPLQFLNYLIEHISQVITILLIIYFVFLIINLLSCKHLLLPNHLALDSRSADLINQLKVEIDSNGLVVTKPAQNSNSLEGDGNKNVLDKQRLTSVDTAEISLAVSKISTDYDSQELQTALPLEQSAAENMGKTVGQKDAVFLIQKRRQQKKNKNKQQDISEESTISKKTLQKYQYLLNKFQTKSTLAKSENKQDKNQKVGSGKDDISALVLSERQRLIKNYIGETEDYKSIFLLQSSENQIFNRHDTKSGARLKEHLEELYSLDNFEEVNRFCVVVNTLNNAQQGQVARTLNSIYNQNYKNYHVVVVDRSSTDSTLQTVRKIAQKPQFSKMTKVIQGKSQSEMSANSQGLQYCKKGEVAIIMDGNSELLTKEAFRLTDSTYQNEKSQVLYSDAYDLDLSKKQIKIAKGSDYDESQIFMNLFRDVSRRYGKYITFNTELLDSIHESFLIDANEEWFKYSHNEALILSLLEASCNKISHIKEPLLLSQFDSSQLSLAAEGLKHEIKQISRKNKVNIC